MRFIFFAIIFFEAVLAFDVPLFSTSSSKGKRNGSIVQDPVAPIYKFGITYYWAGHYKSKHGIQNKCVFLKSDPDWPFPESTFSNGTAVYGVEFGCKKDDLCRKYHCDRPFQTGFIWCAFLILSSVISVGIIVRYIIMQRQNELRPTRDTELGSIYIPVLMINGDVSRAEETPREG